jgi:uncharacterized membrane protein YphA (DoxX/SURF4 family)
MLRWGTPEEREMELIASFSLVARLVLGMTFLVAGVSKLVDGAAFRGFVREVLDSKAAVHAASALPVGEIILGGLILVGWNTRATSLGALASLLVFTGLAAKALRQRTSVPCGCFGGLDQNPVGAGTILRNVCLILLALIGLLPVNSVVSLDSALANAHEPGTGNVIALALAESVLAAATVVAWAGIRLHRRSLSPPTPRDLGDLSRAWYGEDRDDLDQRLLELRDAGGAQ